MKAIVSVDKNWGIGSGNDLLYHIPADMRFFKNTTINNVVIMGQATFFSLPNSQPLKDRINIVLAADESWSHEGVITCHTMEEVLGVANRFDPDRVFVCGGASIYAQMIEYCDEAYITKVDDEAENVEKFFPNLDEMPDWELAETQEPQEHNGITFTFTTYRRKK